MDTGAGDVAGRHVELVRRVYEAAAERRLTELRWAYTPHFELREENSMPEAETLSAEQWSKREVGGSALAKRVVHGDGDLDGGCQECEASFSSPSAAQKAARARRWSTSVEAAARLVAYPVTARAK